MQARIVQSADGARWLAEGWRLFRAAPFGWFMLVFAYLFITNVVMLVPIIGVGAFLVLYPPLSVGLMAAARASAARAPLELGMLFDGFRHGWRAQLLLGAVYLVCSMAILTGAMLAGGDETLRAVLTGKRRADELELSDLFAPLAVVSAMYTPVLMLFWFAPQLAAWHGISAAKSLFFSFVACLMNWRAMLVYGVVTAVIMTALAAGALMLAGLASTKIVPSVLVLPLAILILPTLFASFYASYRDVFANHP